MSLLAVIIVAS